MTLHTVTTQLITCDGTLATACDALHPDKPHGCPERLTIEPGARWVETLDAARWTVVPVPGNYTGTSAIPTWHYCPTHQHQATLAQPVQPSQCTCAVSHLDPTTLVPDCPVHGYRRHLPR